MAAFNPLKSPVDLKIDDVCKPYIQRWNTTGLSIGILKDGLINTYNYGEIKKGTGTLPTTDTIYEIGSITKTFTATILAKFVADGLVSLNEPVVKFLPDDIAANRQLRKIELVHLINHTSGLARLPQNLFLYSNPYRNPYKNYNTARLFAALKKCSLKSVPGDAYAYSNFATGLLGVILERVSGKRYDLLVKEIITGPLKMESTAQHLSAEQYGRLAKGYTKWSFPASNWDFDALAACGALRSTVNDLMLYAQANMANGTDKLSMAFGLAHKVTHNKPQVALGWHLLTYNSADYLWHNGGTGGSRSFLILNAEKKFAAIVLANAAVSCDELAIKMLRALQEA